MHSVYCVASTAENMLCINVIWCLWLNCTPSDVTRLNLTRILCRHLPSGPSVPLLNRDPFSNSVWPRMLPVYHYSTLLQYIALEPAVRILFFKEQYRWIVVFEKAKKKKCIIETRIDPYRKCLWTLGLVYGTFQWGRAIEGLLVLEKNSCFSPTYTLHPLSPVYLFLFLISLGHYIIPLLLFSCMSFIFYLPH